ncbi:MAG: GNAT family N-acetyltransferase [Roseofilum sp. SBFL]|nr:GNAT family N-acetyltransferase [Roseofilum sp. SID3]MBP0025606.1 GNAT family N-acetyltransferase [Roseofilum sp. SID2]MBP0037151.1 GNAT family N-acetyltransferase [Roseofilum sp. SID1]MBP0041666.1 GNAT family N-acetyltransferase [Roseofilum sp. SBFL]
MNVVIEQVSYGEQEEAIASIRIEVSQNEQGVDPSLEFDSCDEQADHLLAYMESKPVGTARVRQLNPETAKIERLAVLGPFRGQGIGRKLMQTALELTQSYGVNEVIITAQLYVQSLYDQLGFIPEGEEFLEAGMPHIKMRKQFHD